MGRDPSVGDNWCELSEVTSTSYRRDTPKAQKRRRTVQVSEAADIFGDVQTAEDYGYVDRGLKSRHIQFLALGGTIGTGLFLGIGRAFAQAGPLSLLLGYTFTGLAVYAMMMSLGEMATWLPLPGAIPQFCSRYVDPAMGFAVGWNSWYQSAITTCAEISAAGVVIQYWEGAKDINVAAWITIIIVLIISLNIFAVSVYGEAEFVFASIKIITIVGLLIFALIVDLGGGPKHDRLGFRYWNHPGAMRAYLSSGSTGRFLGLWSVLVNAAFSYGGVEMVAVAAGEADNPRVNIPKAIRRVFWRILFFYIFGSLAIGVLVPSDDKRLMGASKNDTTASPWVIAAVNAGVNVLPSIINAVILTSAVSSANAFLYTGSRYLYALAQNGQAPRRLLYCTKRGIPYYCIAITASISLLAFLSTGKGSSTVFSWFQSLATIANQFTWMSISIAYIRFHAALKAQGIDRNLFGSTLQTAPSHHHRFFSAYRRRTSPPLNESKNNSSSGINHKGLPISAPQPNKDVPFSSYNPHHSWFHKEAMGTISSPKIPLPPPKSKRSTLHHNALNCNPWIDPATLPPTGRDTNQDPTSPHSAASTDSSPNLNDDLNLAEEKAQQGSSTPSHPYHHMPFRSPLQPYLAYFSLCYFFLVVLFNGFPSFIAQSQQPDSPSSSPSTSTSPTASSSTSAQHYRRFDPNTFITSYIGIVIYLALYLFWKVFKRTKLVRPEEADIWTGKRALDIIDWGEKEREKVAAREARRGKQGKRREWWVGEWLWRWLV